MENKKLEEPPEGVISGSTTKKDTDDGRDERRDEQNMENKNEPNRNKGGR